MAITPDAEAAKQAERARRLRAALDGVDLAPEVTADDATEAAAAAAESRSRDEEFKANRPPHHG